MSTMLQFFALLHCEGPLTIQARIAVAQYKRSFNDKITSLKTACGLQVSRRRGSGRSVIDDIEFPMAILAYFFLVAL